MWKTLGTFALRFGKYCLIDHPEVLEGFIQAIVEAKQSSQTKS